MSCNACRGSLGAPGDLHRIVADILDEAVFKCPYGCSAESITMGALEAHMQEHCPEASKPCPNRCGETVHLAKLDQHRVVCTHEPITCDRCNQVTVPRHQISHHKNESCFAKITCPRCKVEYTKQDVHGMEQCLMALAGRIEKLEQDKVDRDFLITMLLKKVDKKQNESFLHLLVNDFGAARDHLNKQMGSIRIAAPTS